MSSSNARSPIRYCMLGFLNYLGDARVRAYAEWLREAGCQVDVLGLHGPKDVHVDVMGVTIYSIPIVWTRENRLRYLLDYSRAFIMFGWLITRLYFRNRYDVIHVHNMPNFLVFCTLLPKLLGAKIILDVHDPMPEVYLSKYPGQQKSVAATLLYLEERLSTWFADAIITANVHFNRILAGRGVPLAKLTTINNYPDPVTFNPAKRRTRKTENHDHFMLIFPGTLAPRYGLEVAIRAMPLLKERIPNIRLRIIGGQDEHARTLKGLVEQLGVADLVDIWPPRPITEIPEQLLQADVGIYPALPDCHMSLAIPGKVLEFAVLGLPILSSRLQIVEELLGDSAVLFFEPGNINEFAQRVIQLYENPSLRKSLVEAADKSFAERLSREQEVRTYWDLLNRLLPRDSPYFDLRKSTH